MIDRNLARGLFLALVALIFGANSLRYQIGVLSHAGPGLFPLLISGLLLLIAVSVMVRSRFQASEPLHLPLRNIGLLLGSLCAFALVSLWANMTMGIIVMVFIAGFAASSYSLVRNVKISVGLLAVAFAFKYLLGLSLPLI